MRNLVLIFAFWFIGQFCYTQVTSEITEKRNVYNKKGDYYFDKNDFKKAISYYTLAYQKDSTDYFSILHKAEAYTKLKWYPQAELCYRFIFDKNLRVRNTYRLKYALVLLANGKTAEFRHWLDMYSAVVDEEIKSENYLVSSEKRLQLYKDTAIVLVSDNMKTDTVKFKIRYEGYQFKKRSPEEDKELYVVLANGDEFTIAASENNDFKFSFQPMEDYVLILQQEDIKGDDILGSNILSTAQKERKLLNPPPIQKDELRLEKGMVYQFSSGKYKISPQYISSLKELAGKYQSADAGAVDLTALVKEMQLTNDAIYTIRFARVINPADSYKKMEISTVTMNEETINIYGQSFMLLLPDRVDENFAIQTDIEALEKNFSPKKHALKVDDAPLFKVSRQIAKEGLISLNVNTPDIEEVLPDNRFSANEFSIIPGTEYILTLSKPDPNQTEDIEIIVPLTQGVKYNLNSVPKSDNEFKEYLAQFILGRKGVQLTDEEVIDISILSKELEIKPGEEVSFTLLPVKQPGKKTPFQEVAKSKLMLDEKVIEISSNEKYSVNIPFTLSHKMNLQTDLDYLKENFEDNAFTMRLDTLSFTSEISVDTTGYGKLRSSGWLVSMNVNTNKTEEVQKQNHLLAKEISIIPGTEYILTVSKTDAVTGEEVEVIVPLTRNIKYDFTSDPNAEESYKETLDNFLAGRENMETIEGELIDIRLISKELEIKEGDKVSVSLLPVRKLKKSTVPEPEPRSSLYLDKRVVEFTQIQKYTINIPLDDMHQVAVQTDLNYIADNYDPHTFSVDVDTNSFFSEITIDTAGLSDRTDEGGEKIKDPVFDVVVVNFDLNVYALSPEAKKKLQEDVVNELKADNRLYVTIKGYTDALGDPAYNLNLSKKRAESVKEFLKSNGIGESRIRTFSFGAAQLLEKNIDWKTLDESELRKYRKVEIVIYLPKKDLH